MRNFSVGTALYVLLIVGVLFWGPLSQPAVAQSGITFGFVADSSGLVRSSEQGDAVGRFLESQLSIPVKARSFSSEAQLYEWLSDSREVDVAWLSSGFLEGLPEGQFYPLAKNHDLSPGFLRGKVIARHDLNPLLRQELRVAFLRMHESSSGRQLLSHLGVSGFVAPEEEQSLVVDVDVKPQPHLVPPGPTQAEAPIARQESAPAALPLMSSPEKAQELQSAIHTVAVAQNLAPTTVAGLKSVSPSQQVNMTEMPASSPDKPNPGKSSSTTSLSGHDQKAPIALVADSLEYNSVDDSYEAKGDVVLRQAGVELKAEEILWQAATQDAAAKGSVRLKDATTELSSDSLQYNMSTGQGQAHEGRVFVNEGNFHLAGEQIEKQGQVDYLVTNGSFTTCDGEIPDWKFTASEVDVTVGGFASAKNVWFHIKDVPVFYTPYMSFPVMTTRESGFLMPVVGYSNKKGTRASIAWYQVIDRSMDATIYLDSLSEIGLGKGLEYRYALANQNNGKTLFYHVTGVNETPDLYYLEWAHRGELPGKWHLTADIEYTNEQLFFEEFGSVAEDYNRNITVSTLMLRRNWEKLNLVGHARYIKDLDADNDTTLQRLPELGLGLARYRLGDTPFYANLESSATRFWRENGENGERLYVRPSLSAVFTPGSWLEVVPEVAFSERLYNADARDDEQFLPEFSLSLGTRLVKTFDVNRWGLDRIQHSIEPKVTYTYLSDESQNALPSFDVYDRIEGRNDVTYALVNRLTSRKTAVDGSRFYREFLNLRLSQSYDIDEARNNRSGENQPFSDMRLELVFSPTNNFSLDVDGLIPIYGSTKTLNVGSTVRDSVGNALTLNYSYQDAAFAGVAADYVNLQLVTPILKPIYVRFEERYDFRKSRELEKVVGLEYRSKCWSFLLTYRNRYREVGEDEHEVMLQFVLSGLREDQGFGNSLGIALK